MIAVVKTINRPQPAIALPTRLDDIADIPAHAEIMAHPHWYPWKYVFRNGRWHKPPFDDTTGKEAHWKKEHTDKILRPFASAYEQYLHSPHGYCGLSFLNLMYNTVEVDNALHPETGELYEQIQRLFDRLDSYTYVTPSGRGIRLIVRGYLDLGERQRVTIRNIPGLPADTKIEIFGGLNLNTWTAAHMPGTPDTIRHIEKQKARYLVSQIEDNLLGTPPERAARKHFPMPAPTVPMLPPAVIEEARKAIKTDSALALLWRMTAARDRAKFCDLFNGRWQACTYEQGAPRYPSASEAVLALLRILEFWTNGNAALMDALFRCSALYADNPKKWNRKRGDTKHGFIEIQRAIAMKDKEFTGDIDPDCLDAIAALRRTGENVLAKVTARQQSGMGRYEAIRAVLSVMVNWNEGREQRIRATPGLLSSHATILLAIRTRLLFGEADEQGYTRVNMGVLAKITNASKRTIYTVINNAVEQGLLTRRESRNERGKTVVDLAITDALLHGCVVAPLPCVYNIGYQASGVL